MGRKTIAPSQRALPISFSLKPHLIEKIDDYANDLRFSRSKFLQEAVTQYILKTDMGYMAASNNVNDMTLAQKVAVGLAALQEANREGETISKPVMDALRRELGLLESVDAIINPKRIIDIKRVEAGDYNVFDARTLETVAHIFKDSNYTERPWIFSNHLNGEKISSRTLADAKNVAQEELEG